MSYRDLITFVSTFRNSHPTASKPQFERAAAKALKLVKQRSIYVGDGFAVRFSASSKSGFSGTVCGLRRIQQFDLVPLIVVVVRPHWVELLLANATFLDKVSHSSHRLTVNNIRGSINGTNIIRCYSGIENRPENFDVLFSIHQEFTWQENLERLVEATTAIAARGTRFRMSIGQQDAILSSPERAARIVAKPAYRSLKRELSEIVRDRSVEILAAAGVDNVNLRGNQIEQLITGGINEHNLADMLRHVAGVKLQLEIKTKLMDRASSPKAHNVDKALETLSFGDTAISFVFVGIHTAFRQVTASTVSIFDRIVLDATRIQHHWAGRNSRGVTQLTGDLTPLFSPQYKERIDVPRAQEFLRELLAL